MNCSQCGSAIPEGSRFCQACGAPVQEPPVTVSQASQPATPPQSVYQQPQQPPYQPYMPQPYVAPQYPNPPKKKKAGLILGLITGAVVLIGTALALMLLVFSGTSLAGQWVCEEHGQVLVFSGNNTVTGYSLTGTIEGKYKFDKSKGEGTVTANGTKLSLKIDKDNLVLMDQRTDDQSTFVKADKITDPDDIVLSALERLWSCEDIGEVLEFDNGKINVYSGYGDFTGTYKYDLDNGKGSFTVNDTDFIFNADYNVLHVSNTGKYVPADKTLDIKAFVVEHAMPILGMWYETSGTFGTIEFFSNGTAEAVENGELKALSYTFYTDSSSGTLYDYNEWPTSITYNNSMLKVGALDFTRDYIEQSDGSFTGLWYEQAGALANIYFYGDGTFEMTLREEHYYGTYTFDSVSGKGQVTFENTEPSVTWELSLADGVLMLNDVAFSRDVPTIAVDSYPSIVGLWYDVDGEAGTITFYEDNSVLIEGNGKMLVGTYSFEQWSGLGSITVTDGDEQYDMSIIAGGDYLNIDAREYTKEFVEQVG